MSDRPPHQPRLAARPPASTATVWGAHTLPPDLAQKGSRRIGFIGLITALMAPASYVMERFLQPARLMGSGPVPFPEIAAATLFVLGITMFVVAWSRKFSPELVLDLGLVFEVLGALAIALSEHATPLPPGAPVRGISWNCVWITIFVVAVPGTYGKSILAAISAALMQPIGLAITTVVNGSPPPSTNQLLALMAPNFAAALWFIPIARHLHGLRAQVSKERELGSYHLVERIGAGGMGEVWRAQHRMLARPAAIKLIRSEAPAGAKSSVILRRFEREARATAALRSPHTVALYDYGVTEEGELYYVMELLDGLDFESLVGRFGPQPPARVIHLLRQVCRSLAEAHEYGLVHRDIKPRNLMICRLGVDLDFVKVLDFGLAKYQVAGGETETQLTADGVAAGTPAYMAPEAAVGMRGLDGRADLYQLGCVGYWLLTGRLVFERETPMAMVVAHINEAPVRPSERTEIPIPERLESVILKCLEKDPARRPQSARELDQLLAACDGSGAWTPDDAVLWWRTHMPAVSTISVDAVASEMETA